MPPKILVVADHMVPKPMLPNTPLAKLSFEGVAIRLLEPMNDIRERPIGYINEGMEMVWQNHPRLWFDCPPAGKEEVSILQQHRFALKSDQRKEIGGIRDIISA